MIVAVALFEIHIEHAQSLKEKRQVVKSLREKLRNRFNVSAAEVGLQDLHQRGRIGLSLVAVDEAGARKALDSVADFVEEITGGRIAGWTQELFDFDAEANLGIPRIDWTEEQ